MKLRPACIVSPADVTPSRWQYPGSPETHGVAHKLGRAAGLKALGINILTLAPGERSSWPHAESTEEEFVYVLEGQVHAWLDGEVYPMQTGELAAFPAGTGICHCFINNSATPVRLLIGGHADRDDNRIYYPLHPQRRNDLPAAAWWDDIPLGPQGPHDGKPGTPT